MSSRLSAGGVVVGSRSEELEQELLDRARFGQPCRSVADADGGEVGELVEDLAPGRAADALGEQAPLVGGERGQAAAYLAFDQPVEQQREADDGDEGGDATIAVQEDGAHGERPLEVGEAALDEVLALVGAEELVCGEGVVVADEAVAAVEQLGLGEGLLVDAGVRLRPAVLLGDRESQEAIDAAALEDRLRPSLDLGGGAAKLADTAVEAGELLVGARALFGPLLASGFAVVEGEDVEGAQLVTADLDRRFLAEVAGRAIPVPLGAVCERLELVFGERGQAVAERPVLRVRAEEAKLARAEGAHVCGREQLSSRQPPAAAASRVVPPAARPGARAPARPLAGPRRCRRMLARAAAPPRRRRARSRHAPVARSSASACARSGPAGRSPPARRSCRGTTAASGPSAARPARG